MYTCIVTQAIIDSFENMKQETQIKKDPTYT